MTDQDDEKVDQVSEPTTGETADGKDLLPAAESSDPTVQQLLAERESARLNKDEDAAKDIAKRLADLGYE